MPSATFDALAVVAVPFPFSDRGAFKRRPALVVSSSVFNESHAHRILAMITTTSAAWPSDVTLDDYIAAGLPRPSRMRLKIFTLDLHLIERQLGAVSDSDARKVLRALRLNLSVPSPEAP